MTNIDKLKEAKRALEPKKKFKVTIREERFFDAEVEAVDREDAEKHAWEEYHNGNLSDYGDETEITDVEENT